MESKLDRWITEGRYVEDTPVGELMEEFGVTEEEFRNYFSKCMGVPFMTWRKHLRIRRAMELMADNTGLSTNEVGNAVGIKDKSNFRKEFKSIVGCTPAEYMEIFNKQ